MPDKTWLEYERTAILAELERDLVAGHLTAEDRTEICERFVTIQKLLFVIEDEAHTQQKEN